MKNINEVEVILFAGGLSGDLRRKELVKWIGTTAQPAIDRQKERAKKILLRTLKNTPAIYLS